MSVCRLVWAVVVLTVAGRVRCVAVYDENDLRARSQEFVNLLNVELSVGGESWEKQLEPALKFVQDIQEESIYLDWLRYFARFVSASTGATLKDTEAAAAASGSNPLNFLTFLIQHLLTDENIDKAVAVLASGAELNLPSVPEDFLARLKPTKEKNLGRFSKRLYNAKRKHSKPVVLQPVTTPAPAAIVDQLSAANSKVDIEAIRAVLVDIIKELKASSTTEISPTEASTKMSSAGLATTEIFVSSVTTTTVTTTTSTTTTAATTTTTTTTTTPSTTTTAEVVTTTLSIEERIAALSAKFSNVPTESPPSSEAASKPSFVRKFKSTTFKPRLPKTTTEYEKYPVFSTTPSTVETYESTSPTTEALSTLQTTESDVWAESDVTVCLEHRSCIFKGKIFVSGFEATSGREWNETSSRLTKAFAKILHRIFDSNLGPIQNDLSVRKVARTSTASAEIVFELKLTESEFSIDSAKLLRIMNRADASHFFPYDIDRALTHFQLVNPDARQSDNLIPSPYVDSSGLSPVVIPSVMATLLIGGPLVIWASVLVIRRLRAKNLKRRLIDQRPLVYSELEAAISSLKSNNLYSSTGKKATLSRTSMFDAEREKEIYKKYEARREAQKEEDEKTGGADRPLPPVPGMTDSPKTSSLKRSKQPSAMSKWFAAEKKNVTFAAAAAADLVDADRSDDESGDDGKEKNSDDDLSVYSPRLPSPRSPSFRRRHSSVYRASFRQFISSIRMRRERVMKGRSTSRTSVEGFFNDAYVPEDARGADGQSKRQNEYKVDESPDGRNLIDHQHDYAVITYKPDKKNNDDSIEIYSTVGHKSEAGSAPGGAERNEVKVVAQVHRQNLETSTEDDDDGIYGII